MRRRYVREELRRATDIGQDGGAPHRPPRVVGELVVPGYEPDAGIRAGGRRCFERRVAVVAFVQHTGQDDVLGDRRLGVQEHGQPTDAGHRGDGGVAAAGRRLEGVLRVRWRQAFQPGDECQSGKKQFRVGRTPIQPPRRPGADGRRHAAAFHLPAIHKHRNRAPGGPVWRRHRAYREPICPWVMEARLPAGSASACVMIPAAHRVSALVKQTAGSTGGVCGWRSMPARALV